VYALKTEDKRAMIEELQWLQRELNLLQEVYQTNPDQSIENSIKILKTSQDKLYGTLVKNKVTAEEVEKIIKWKEIIDSPDRKELIEKIEKEQGKTLTKSRGRGKTHDLE
jgi:hypothetical protein